jgi:hypothetical protein
MTEERRLCGAGGTVPFVDGGDIPLLRKLEPDPARQRTARALRQALTGDAGQLSVAMRNLLPEEVAELRAEYLWQLGKPTAPRQPGRFSPADFAQRWGNLPQATRDLLLAGDPELTRAAENVGTLAEAIVRRGDAASWAPRSWGGVAYALGGPLAWHFGALAPAAATAAGSAVAARVLSGGMAGLAIAAPGPTMVERLAPHLPGAAERLGDIFAGQ